MKIHLKGFSNSREVILNGKQLNPKKSQQLINHSPDGFNWGYGGSGPSQLALAICLEVYKEEKGIPKYQGFKFDHITTLPQTDFETVIEFDYDKYKPGI